MTTIFDMSYASLYMTMTEYWPSYPDLVMQLDEQLQQILDKHNMTVVSLFREVAIK